MEQLESSRDGNTGSRLDEALRRVPLFAHLSGEQFDKIKKGMQLVRLQSEEILFRQDQPAEHFYYLRAGRIKLFRLSPEGQEKVIEIIHPGWTFAEAVMFMENKRFPVNAEAIGECRVVAFSHQVYLDLLRESPENCFVVLGGMSRWLRRQIAEIDRLTLQSATIRLVAYLLQLAPPTAQGAVNIELSVPKRVIASRLSMQPETFSRLLQGLSRNGLLTVRDQTLEIPDIEQLRAMVNLEHDFVQPVS